MRYTRFVLSLFFCLIAVFGTLAPVSAVRAQEAPALQEPEVSARAAIVVEYPSGRILYQKGMHDRLAPASTTKILTAILAIEHGDLNEWVTAAPEDLVGESSMGLVAGEQITLRDLLYGLMLPSGNDAAMTIARVLGSKSTSADPLLQDPARRFVSMMNARVAQLGLENSNFNNPHGLDEDGHYSSAYDLASLTWYAMHLPDFNEVVKQVSHDLPGHGLLNTNELLTRYEGADGVKTGFTDYGGLCLVGSATRGGTRLISVVLNAPRWYQDSGALLDYGYARLAALPDAAVDAQLSVSKQGAASWLLGNAPEAPSVPVVAEAPQGGGAAQSGPASNALDAGAAPPAEPDFSPTQIQAPRTDPAGNLLSLGVYFSVGLGLLLLLSRSLFRVNLRAVAGRFVAGTVSAFVADEDVLPVQGASPTKRRRTPSLLPEVSGRDSHVVRALQLAEEGREGSSMSEFLLALRNGPITIEDLSGDHRLPPTAFLALARAQTALGHYSDARTTLLHGVTVLPQNRILSLALHQLSGDLRER